MTYPKKNTVLYLSCISISALMGMLIPKKWIYPLFEHTGYYFILIAFFIWIYLFLILFHLKLFPTLKTHYKGVFLTLFITLLIFFISPPRFKILSDETNLLGTSMSMFQSKKVSLPIQGVYYTYKPAEYISKTIDKRPLLYPFLVSLMHSVMGYRPLNAFIINAMAAWLSLFLIYLLITQHFNRIWGFLSVLIFSSMPLFSFWVTSGGFEAVNMLFAIITFYIFTQLSPSTSTNRIAFFLFTLNLFAQCRYESIIFSALVPAIYFLCNLKEREISLSKLSLLSAFFYIPILLQLRLYVGEPLVEEVNQQLTAHSTLYSAFSLGHLIRNFPNNLSVFLGFNPHFGFSPVISLFSLTGLYLFFKKACISSGCNQIQKFYPFIIFSMVLMILGGIHFSYFYSNLRVFTQNRFALIYLPFIVILAIYGLRHLFPMEKRNQQLLILVSAIHLLLLLPYIAQDRLANFGFLSLEYQKVHSTIEKRFHKADTILIISDHPYIYISSVRGAFDFTYANQNEKVFQEKYLRTFDHILILQKFNYKNHAPLKNNTLSKIFRVEEITRLNLTESTYMKISRMK